MPFKPKKLHDKFYSVLFVLAHDLLGLLENSAHWSVLFVNQRERDRAPAEPHGGDGTGLAAAAGRPEEEGGRVRAETPAAPTAADLQTEVIFSTDTLHLAVSVYGSILSRFENVFTAPTRGPKTVKFRKIYIKL